MSLRVLVMFSSQATQKKPIWHNRVWGLNPKLDALAVLREAAENCLERDMQTDDVLSALAYLAESTTRPYVFQRFRQALRIVDAAARQQAVSNAYDSVERYLTGNNQGRASGSKASATSSIRS